MSKQWVRVGLLFLPILFFFQSLESLIKFSFAFSLFHPIEGGGYERENRAATSAEDVHLTFSFSVEALEVENLI
jgi:hypothetical protein